MRGVQRQPGAAGPRRQASGPGVDIATVRTERAGATAVYAWSASRNLYVSSAAAFAMIAYDAANARYVWRIQPVDAIV